MVAHIATRIVDSSRTNIQGVGDDTNYTLPSGTNVIVLCSSVQDQGDRFLTSLNYHLQYSTNGTNWFDVPTSGTDTVPRLLGSNTGTALTDNSGVTSGERRAAPTSNPSEDGFVSNGGREHTTSNQLNYGAKVDDSQCEAQFALDFQYASAGTYRFRIVWGSRSGDSNINQTSAVAVPAGGTTHNLTASTTTASVAVSAANITAQQTHSLNNTVNGVPDFAVISATATITSGQVHNLTGSADVTCFDRDAGANLATITAQQTHSLTASATTASAAVESASITGQQTHELVAEATNAGVTVSAGITGQQTHELVGSTTQSVATSSASITGQQTHGLTSTTTSVATTATASITAQQTHELTAQAANFAATSSAVISGQQTHELVGATTTSAITASATITGQQTHTLVATTTNAGATVSAGITGQQTHELIAEAASLATTATGSVAGQQTHDLTNSSTAGASLSAAITGQQTHEITQSIGAATTVSGTITSDAQRELSSSVTSSATLSVSLVQTHTPESTANTGSALVSAGITAQQTHQLTASASSMAVSAAGTVTAVQSHALTSSATDAAATISGSITAQQTHELTASATSMSLTAAGVITGVQTHDLTVSAVDASVTISTSITAQQTHELVAVGLSAGGSASGSITADQTWEINPDPDPDVIFTISAAVTVTTGPQIRSLVANEVIARALAPTGLNNIVSAHDWVLTHQNTLTFNASADASLVRETQHSLVASMSVSGAATSTTTQSLALTAAVTATAGASGQADGSGAAGESSGSGSATATADATIRVQYVLQVVIDGVGDIEENLLTRSEIVAIEEIWNTGLTQLGVATVNSATNDTSPQAVLLRSVWPNFRKQFISDHAWNGCKTTASLTAMPDSDFKDTTRWSNIFSLPSDYIRALTVNGHRNQPDNSESVMWEIEAVANTSGVKSRCLCTNQSTAKLEYVFDVGDNVDLLAPAMKHALGLAFGAFVAPNFGKSANEIALLEQKVKEALLKARGIDGQENSARYFSPSELVESRYRSL